MKKYPLLDIFRLICACLVALIHKGAPEGTLGDLIKVCFSAQAVPFFFITSGFFFAAKLDKAENKKAFVLNYASRMFIFYMLWILIQFPSILRAYTALYPDASWPYLAAVLARRILLAGNAPFWYLLALSETALVAGILLSCHKEKLLVWLGGIGLCMNYLYTLQIPLPVFQQFYKLVYAVFSWNNNFIMIGIPFFTIGVLFSRNLERIRVRVHTVVYLYVAVSAVSVACFVLLRRTGLDVAKYLYLFTPQAVGLFLVGILAADIPVPEKISGTCRSLSAAIYCLHMPVLEWVFGKIIPWSPWFAVNYWGIIALCIVIYYVAKLGKIRPLYRLITLK